MASRLPVVLFHPLPGHGRINARTLEAAGVAAYARTDRDLVAAVRLLSRSATSSQPSGPARDGDGAAETSDPVAAILALAEIASGPAR